MHYMVLCRADAASETPNTLPLNAMLWFEPSASAVRLHIDAGGVTVRRGPFPDTAEMVAGFGMIEAASLDDAIAQTRAWPVPPERAAVLEIRRSGCPEGCSPIIADGTAYPDGRQFAVLLRSSEALEGEVPVGPGRIDALDRHNAEQARAGVLLAGDGLRSAKSGARVKLAAGKSTVLDGPFTEIKELIAGYWLIQVPSMDDAIAWASSNPYPSGPPVDVEIRPVAATPRQGFASELLAAERGMRSEQLEAAMLAQLAGR
jgi:hypothetical protein